MGIVIADEIEGEALATLVLNKLRGSFNTLAIKAPGFGDRRKEMLEDIAAVTGTTVISEEIGDPLGGVFGQICQEQALGLDLKDSIRKVSETTYSSELKLFATAIAIQFQSGGNLADLMDRLAAVIRARMRLNQRIRVITAQTQFSKRVLIALPVLLFVTLNIINPQYMQPFYVTAAGKYMLATGGASFLFGIWIMNRISIIRS